MKSLKIDPEFRDKVPPMTETEFKTLEENIINDGKVLMPIMVWNETIIDGHNRYSIVQKHPEIPFKVEEMEFSDRYEAIVWICRNQLGRRNLTDEQKTYLIGKQYEAQKMTVSNAKGINQHTKEVNLQNDDQPKLKTVHLIAKEHNIGSSSVERAEKFAKGVDEAEDILPGAKQKVLSGDTSIPKSVIAAIPTMSDDEKLDVVQMIETGKYEKPEKVKKLSNNPAGFNKEARENKAQIEAIVADMYDPTTVPEFTIDLLIEDIQANAENYVSMLRNTLTDRSTLLTEENRPLIADAIERYVIQKIMKVKELVT